MDADNVTVFDHGLPTRNALEFYKPNNDKGPGSQHPILIEQVMDRRLKLSAGVTSRGAMTRAPEDVYIRVQVVEHFVSHAFGYVADRVIFHRDVFINDLPLVRLESTTFIEAKSQVAYVARGHLIGDSARQCLYRIAWMIAYGALFDERFRQKVMYFHDLLTLPDPWKASEVEKWQDLESRMLDAFGDAIVDNWHGNRGAKGYGDRLTMKLVAAEDDY